MKMYLSGLLILMSAFGGLFAQENPGERLGRPKIAFVYDPRHAGDEGSEHDRRAEQILGRPFVEAHYQVVHLPRVNELLKMSENLKRLGTEPSVAKELGEKYGADILILYRITTEVLPKQAAWFVVHDSISVRVISADTGQTLAQDEVDSQGFHSTSNNYAHRDAIEKIVVKKKLGQYLMTEINRWWDEYARLGQPVKVSFYLQNVGPEVVEAIKAAGAKVEGVSGTFLQQRMQNNQSENDVYVEYDVRFKGDSGTFQTRMLAALNDTLDTIGLARNVYINTIGRNVTFFVNDPVRTQALIERAGQLAPPAEGETASAPGPDNPGRLIGQIAETSVVTIHAGENNGTGFVVSADGKIVTNAHVVGKAQTVTVEFASGTKISGKVIAANDSEDLALIGLDDTAGVKLVPVKIGNSDGIANGDTVYVAGSSMGLKGNICMGVIGAASYPGPPADLAGKVFYSSLTHPGNSGGPVFNLKGEVVAVHSAGVQQTQQVLTENDGRVRQSGVVVSKIAGLGFGIPINRAKKLFNLE